MTGALVLSLAMLAAFPLYATFRDGVRAVTAEGREEIHAEAQRMIVAEVDATVREAAAGLPVKVDKPAGTREGDDNGSCERVHYAVVIAR